MDTLSSRLTKHGLPKDGTFSILNAWDDQPSGYVITLQNGAIVRVEKTDNPLLKIDSGVVNGYLDKNFELLRAISGGTSEPTGGEGNEDALGLGYYNESAEEVVDINGWFQVAIQRDEQGNVILASVIDSEDSTKVIDLEDLNRYLKNGRDLVTALMASMYSTRKPLPEGVEVNTSMDQPVQAKYPKMDLDHFIELLREIVPMNNQQAYNEYIEQYRQGIAPELLLKQAQREFSMPVAESKLYNRFVLLVSESNFAEAMKVLEQITEAKIARRVQEQLDEGFFDRVGARAAGLGAGVKAKAQNFATRAGSAVKAVGQNIGGAVTGKGFSQGQATVDAANKEIAANDPRKKAKAAQADNLIASFAKDLEALYPGMNTAKVLQSLRTLINLTPVASAKPAAPAAAPTPAAPAPSPAIPPPAGAAASGPVTPATKASTTPPKAAPRRAPVGVTPASKVAARKVSTPVKKGPAVKKP
jgi:hypothetical protein